MLVENLSAAERTEMAVEVGGGRGVGDWGIGVDTWLGGKRKAGIKALVVRAALVDMEVSSTLIVGARSANTK